MAHSFQSESTCIVYGSGSTELLHGAEMQVPERLHGA